MKQKKYVKRVQVSLTKRNLEKLTNYIKVEKSYHCGSQFKMITFSEVINMCIDLVIK